MFRSPLTDAAEINARAGLVGWFRGCGAEMFLTEEDVEAVEFYMGFHPSSGKAGALADMLLCRARQIVLGVPSWQKVLDGIAAVSSVIVRTDRLLSSLPEDGCPIAEEVGKFRQAFPEDFVRELETVGTGELPFGKAVSLDRRLRAGRRAQIGEMMELLYDLDVWLSVSSVAADKGFCAAEAVDSKDSFIEIENVRHPALKSAVPNDIDGQPFQRLFPHRGEHGGEIDSDEIRGDCPLSGADGLPCAGDRDALHSYGRARYLNQRFRQYLPRVQPLLRRGAEGQGNSRESR